VEICLHTIREEIYYSGYIVEDEWRPSGEYMEGDKDMIYYIYTYKDFEQNIFIDNNERLTLERRNICNPYRRIIIHYKDISHKENTNPIIRGLVFFSLEREQKNNFFYGKK